MLVMRSARALQKAMLVLLPLSDEGEQEKGCYSDLSITSPQHLSVKQPLWKYLCLLLSLRQHWQVTCTAVAPGRRFFLVTEGCETLDYMLVITAYWLLFLSCRQAAGSGVAQGCAGIAEDIAVLFSLSGVRKSQVKERLYAKTESCI